jgi:hypothetical protein
MGWGKRVMVWMLALWLCLTIVVQGIGWGPGVPP